MSVIFTLRRNVGTVPAGGSGPQDHGNGFTLEGDNGAAVVLVHGLTGTPNEMRFLATYLNRKGYTVICPRLANHGEPLSVLKKTRWQDFYASVREVMTGKRVTGNPGPVYTGGLSMGALLALLAADEFRERVAGVSCLATTLFYDGWNTPGAKYFMPLACTPLKNFFYFKEEPPYGVRNEAIRNRIHRYYANATLDRMDNVAQYGYPFFPVTQLYQLQLLVRHLTRRLGRIRTPVQLIQAKDDDMTSVKNSKFVYDRIGSETKEMIFLYNSYHVITVDQERETVAEKMGAFFGRLRACGGAVIARHREAGPKQSIDGAPAS
jgi:carboxylesterase